MAGYESLAAYYGALFPLSDGHRALLGPLAGGCRERGEGWLDVGCGVGALLEWLAARGVAARGLEPDADFVAEARRRLGAAARVVPGGMESIGAAFQSEAFGVITLLGNVLAHADGPAVVGATLAAAARRLVAGGVLVAQVVNFDRALRTADGAFPLLRRVAPDGAALIFERHYDISEFRRGGRLRFRTRLTVGERVIENATWLYPMLRCELEPMARAAFPAVEFLGDFGGGPWSPDSPATILIARMEAAKK